MEGPHIDHHTFIQGKDDPSESWQINYFSSIDVTDAWTQLGLLAFVVFTYGFAITYYVHTKKFVKAKTKSQRHSKAWKAWDKNKVNFNYPHITRHNDFLGWEAKNNAKEFQGFIYLYCMPNSGPCRKYVDYLKKKMIPGLQLERIPMRSFFFNNRRYLDADRLDDTPKKYPFTELAECLKEIDLHNSVPCITISLPQSATENEGLDLKVTTTFEIDAELKQHIEEMFERLKFDIAKIDGTNQPETKKLIFETQILNSIS